MSNRNVEFFRTYLRVLAARVSYVDTARALRISEDWIYKCLSASKAASLTPDEPSVFRFESEEGDGEPQWFHQHVRDAISMSVQAIEAAVRSRALHGTDHVSMYKGQTQYKINPDWLDEGMRDLLGLDEGDKYLRDARGNLIPETTHTEPPVDLQLAVLGAHGGKKYRKANAGTTVNVSAGGVQVVGQRPTPQIAAPLPVLENVEQADFAEVDDGPDDLSVTDTPQDEPEPDEPEVAPTPAPAPVSYSVPTPAELAPIVNPILRTPLSADERATLGLPRDNSGTRAALRGAK
jgi:hypothetical protein